MNLNSGKPWSQTALYDLRYWLEHGDSVEQVADLLCRDVNEVREKMVELGIREAQTSRPPNPVLRAGTGADPMR
jgi:hypothetical protein